MINGRIRGRVIKGRLRDIDKWENEREGVINGRMREREADMWENERKSDIWENETD